MGPSSSIGYQSHESHKVKRKSSHPYILEDSLIHCGCLQDTPDPCPQGRFSDHRVHSHLPAFIGPSAGLPLAWCLESIPKHPYATFLRILPILGCWVRAPASISSTGLKNHPGHNFISLPPFNLQYCDNLERRVENSYLIFVISPEHHHKVQLALLRREKKEGKQPSPSKMSQRRNEAESLSHSVPGSRASVTSQPASDGVLAGRKRYCVMLMLRISESWLRACT